MSAASFAKGDRVELHGLKDDATYNGRRGVVTGKPTYKAPRGKHMGWWYWVRLDPPPGIKKWEAEVNQDYLREAKS